MKKKLISIILTAVLIVGLSAAVMAETDKYGGVWKDALQSNPPQMDPAQSTDTKSAEMIYQLFETLVEYDSEGNIKPLLAESWDISEDAQTYTFHLRKGVHFHAETEGGTPTANGGREVTAEDWVWTFNHITSPETKSPRAYFIDMIKGYDAYRNGETDKLAGVRAVDKYTLEVELEKPFAPFLGTLAYNTFVVMPKEDVNKWGEDWNFHPVGTGAFKFESWEQDSVVRMSRNDNYWMKDEDGNQLPYLEALEFRIIPDYTMMWEEFQIGNIYQTYVDDPFYLDAKENYPDTFFELPQLGTYYYGMNVEKEPFDDKRVRQAMNYAINREMMIELVQNGRNTPAKGIIPPTMFGYNEELEGYSYNPDKARALLAEAGYQDGFEVTLQYNTSKGHKRVAEALQAQYRQVGIDVKLQNLDWGSHLDSVERGEAAFFRMGWVADYNDPDNFLYVLLHSDNIGPEGNYARFSNERFDTLTEYARLETDPEKRKQAYQQAEKIAVEEAPWVFIYHYTTHSLVQPYVNNYELPAFGQHANLFRDVWISK
ncbi:MULTISPECIES: ABC transporter substrate-binding protein [unclassified Halanaerobium]|uniref:ABC transporter substrate-binding protein n=1 Tax=unclassified Halanaerobium TaxID=2641197 RepID=UPI000DF2ECC4|nr:MULTISPECIES: ABC transporter substrate-binding protein [unclassified Halanaerobium]RCW48777.1 peptide/nickel transport system substrate-binding protein/oligopeptide transport system substrate-binding protein [Halanaerobium sp. MA284_MarDTE_T2]RCW89119.1 peptide/nickel transport system substrate-binding protein/oligopeptide transport system substrate-binding protein [Halanaerobium sp. DL-01]